MNSLVMLRVQVSVWGRPVLVVNVIHAIFEGGWKEGGSGACVDVAVEIFQHEVGELEDSEDVAWDWQLELLEETIGSVHSLAESHSLLGQADHFRPAIY